jgi:hypothetical protein
MAAVIQRLAKGITMRTILGLLLVLTAASCGSDTVTPIDAAPVVVPDAPLIVADAPTTPTADAMRVDAHPVMPFNMPGMVYCYGMLTCSTTSAMPVCCDSPDGDGGFGDTCTADIASCTAMGTMARAFQCGQAADCGAGMQCCGQLGMSSGGNPFFNGTTCSATCAATDTQLCIADGDCTGGLHCMAKRISGRNVGLCQ